MTMTPERLREACKGHPAASVTWPHRLLHDAADEIEQLRADVDRLYGDLVKLGTNGFGWMRCHDKLLGFIQQRSEMLAELIANDPREAMPSVVDVPKAIERAEAAEQERDRYKAVVDAAEAYRKRAHEVEEVRAALEESGGAAGSPMEGVYERLSEAETSLFKKLAALKDTGDERDQNHG